MNLSLTEGQRLQREGQETVEERNAEWLVKMREYAKYYSDGHGYVTTDYVRLYATSLGLYPTHHNAWGCVFKQKGWTVVGRQPSKLPSNHAREIRVYRWEGNAD